MISVPLLFAKRTITVFYWHALLHPGAAGVQSVVRCDISSQATENEMFSVFFLYPLHLDGWCCKTKPSISVFETTAGLNLITFLCLRQGFFLKIYKLVYSIVKFYDPNFLEIYYLITFLCSFPFFRVKIACNLF